MPILKTALAATLSLGLAGPALAQAGSGNQPGVAPGQAPQPQPNRPQSDSRSAITPQPMAANLRDYATMLKSAQEQLQAAVQRSGSEPAANQQRAVTPAWMDLKAASQAAFETLRRAPTAFRQEQLYQDADNRIQQDLGVITQAMQPESGREAAHKLLTDFQSYVQEVSRRAESAPG